MTLTASYDPSTALDLYNTSRETKAPARHWAGEKLLHDLGYIGFFAFFEGPGPDPTGLAGYASNKIWLKTTAGVTTSQGTYHVWLGATPATTEVNWVTLTPATYQVWLRGENTGLDFLWSTATSGDPGSGHVGIDAATLATATSIRVSKTGRNGESLGATIDAWDASTNSVKGTLRLFAMADRGNEYLEASITGALTDNSTYWTVPISLSNGAGTPALEEPMSIMFQRAGDAGGDTIATVTFANRTDPALTSRVIFSDEKTGSMLCYSDGGLWRRTSDGRPAQSAAVNYYLDSTVGSSGNGLTAGAAFKTLADLQAAILALPSYRRQGLRIQVQAGSNFTGAEFNATAEMAGIVFVGQVAASGRMPIVDGSTTVTKGSITSLGGNLYSYTVSVGWSLDPAEYPSLWADDQRYTRVAAGSVTRPYQFSSSNPVDAASITITFMAPAMGDPRSDAVVYHVSVASCLQLRLAEGSEVEGIECRRPYHSYGCFSIGKFGSLRNFRAIEGNSHSVYLMPGATALDGDVENWHGQNPAAVAGEIPVILHLNAGSMPRNGGPVCERVRVRCRDNVFRARAAVTGITLGTSTVVTLEANHGYVANDVVIFSGIGGTTELNGLALHINSVSGNDLTMRTIHPITGSTANINSSAYGAYTSGGVCKLTPWGTVRHASGGPVGFYAHTNGTEKFPEVTYKNCCAEGCATAFDAADVAALYIIDCDARQCQNLFKATGAEFLTVRGCTSKNILPIPAAGIGVAATDGMTVTVESCAFYLHGGVGIQMGASAAPRSNIISRIRNNRFNGCSMVTIYGAGGDHEITHNNYNAANFSGITPINAPVLTNGVLRSDFNNWGGEDVSINLNGAVTTTLTAWRDATDNDRYSTAYADERDVLTRSTGAMTLSGTQNNLRLPPGDSFVLTASSPTTISGIDGGYIGRIIKIALGGAAFTIQHQNAASELRNQIITATNANIVTADAAAVTLLYRSDNYWHVMGFEA